MFEAVNCWFSGPPPGKASSTATAGITTDSLVVSLDDVRRISGVDALQAGPRSEVRQPRHSNSDAPGPCRAVFDQEATLDDGWTQFRSVTFNGDTYGGVGDVKIRGVANVIQAVGIYRDDGAARAAFDRLVSTLTACSGLHAANYDFTLDQTDPSTVAFNSDQWKLIYRVKSSALINVGALGLPQSEQTARTIDQTITDRIK
ncbi:sensor domain-containing protein [Mycobacterium sp. 663a-19]|uniref:sensor domain-containing protein n=1 Tax=Mycobacterium sp. 663a-19 TaxID=2986148 RepID=UPI002D1F57DD|nr:sensor domain-containing protein [Mycobacterium sp. 663a-19]MEB3983889.1 sensor domain-containing protein [Mycobacterium sp. 663a-19]